MKGMAEKFERARGTRDFAAGDALLRQKIVATLRKVFELYGYNPLETPILERFETLASKYAGGAEILKETFRLKDQGDRELGLRYDLTVPMCRFIATNPNLKMPFKRYQIGEVFRDGPLKAGRYREFMQCDIDIVGVKSMAADAEMVDVAANVFRQLQLNVVIKVNNRKLLNAIIAAAGIAAEKAETTILTLDKLEKFGKDAVEKELAGKGIPAAAVKKLMPLIAVGGNNSEKMLKLEKEIASAEGKEGLAELKELFSALETAGNVSFEPSLARGLSYYTGTVFEVFLKDSELTSTIAAGGRYDRMIGSFVGGGREYPAVGISFGLDIIEDAIIATAKEKAGTTTKAYVIPIKAAAEARKIAALLRQAGISTDIDLNNRDIKRNLEYAASAGIPYAIFIGEKEAREGKVKLRDMKTGEEKDVTAAEAERILNK